MWKNSTAYTSYSEKWPALLEPLLERLNQVRTTSATYLLDIDLSTDSVRVPYTETLSNCQQPSEPTPSASSQPYRACRQYSGCQWRPGPCNTSATSTSCSRVQLLSHLYLACPRISAQLAACVLTLPNPRPPPANAHLNPINAALLLLPESATHHPTPSRTGVVSE